ncbi:hypothetical protein AMATHDRAFT_7896 [Amanita thiersii Skay4041]|uniref:Uncharacterized protein n=1 Tax=Amanita thiersii Skay4041 TaxID=703135 RepID=A0A2A9NF76_9AGAR|nr:hypothetical protein AMATHDRAFT_7896 [Amanita thiersii Skay4041]
MSVEKLVSTRSQAHTDVRVVSLFRSQWLIAIPDRTPRVDYAGRLGIKIAAGGDWKVLFSHLEGSQSAEQQCDACAAKKHYCFVVNRDSNGRPNTNRCFRCFTAHKPCSFVRKVDKPTIQKGPSSRKHHRLPEHDSEQASSGSVNSRGFQPKRLKRESSMPSCSLHHFESDENDSDNEVNVKRDPAVTKTQIELEHAKRTVKSLGSRSKELRLELIKARNRVDQCTIQLATARIHIRNQKLKNGDVVP